MARDDIQKLYARRADLSVQMSRMVAKAEYARRSLTLTEADEFKKLEDESAELDRAITRAKLDEAAEQALRIPAEQRSRADAKRVRFYRARLYAEVRALVEKAEDEGRNMTADEAAEFDRLQHRIDVIGRDTAAPVTS